MHCCNVKPTLTRNNVDATAAYAGLTVEVICSLSLWSISNNSHIIMWQKSNVATRFGYSNEYDRGVAKNNTQLFIAKTAANKKETAERERESAIRKK